MKPIISHILIMLLLSTGMLMAQQQGEHIVLEQPIAGPEHEFEASKSIRFLPGFSYQPQFPDEDLGAWINPYLIIPHDGDLEGGYPGGFTSGVVGSTASQVSVSPSGAAVVSVPLPSPPGVAGMVPQLALVYSSQSGNGPFGYGWSLAGLSAISRTGKTIYHDGYTDGIRFEGTDNYALDGQRLIAVDEQGIVYRTEVESFSKIKPQGQAGDGPVSFVVNTKNFMTYRYGASESSRIEASGKNSVLSWLLSSAEDENGNFIEYQYIETNGYGYIDKILYGGNHKTGQEHFYEIRFVYKTGRNDAMISFIAGSTIGIDKIVQKIEYYYEGQLLHSYELGSITSNFYCRLNNITEKNHIDNKKFNPTILGYGDHNHAHREIEFNRELGSSVTHFIEEVFLDINGDGLTDKICIEYKPTEGGNKEVKSWWYRLRLNTENFSAKMYFNGTEPSKWYKYLLVGDYNGDGLQDFIYLKYDYTFLPKTLIIAERLFLSNGNGFNVYQLSDIVVDDFTKPEFRRGDFDGDGKDELLLALKNIRENFDGDPSNDVPSLFIFKFKTTIPYAEVVFQKTMEFGNTDFDRSTIIVSDFTGDGKSDILRTAEYGGSPHTSNCFIYGLNFVNNELEVIYGSPSNGYPTTWHQIYPADFNGDGITDIMTYNFTASNPRWEIALFTGKGGDFIGIDTPDLGSFNLADLSDAWSNSLNLVDYNGDGKTDIMKLTKTDYFNADYKIYYSNGKNFDEVSTGTIKIVGGFSYFLGVMHENIFPYYDFNGDGKSDLYTNGTTKSYIYLLDESNEYLKIKKVTNGLGHKTEIVYQPLTKTPFYTKGTGAEFPLTDIQPALHAVSMIMTGDPANNVHHTTYQYEGMKLHKQGKGLLGFMRTTTESFVNNSQISQSQNINELNDEYYFLWPQIVKTSVVKDGGQSIILLSETTNQAPIVEPFGGKRHFYYIARSLTKESDLDGFVRSRLSTRDYSDNDIQYGNITSEASYVSPQLMTLESPVSAYDFSSVNNFTYYPPDNQLWLISRPHVHNSQVWEKNDGNHIDAKKTYTYKSSSNLVETVTTLPDNEQSLSTVTNYIYDSYGNAIFERTQAPNSDPPLPPMATGYVFSSLYKHRFVTEEHVINSDGPNYTTLFQYDGASGRIKNVTDANNLSTYYYYDGFGRQVKTLFPDKVQQQSQVFWADGHEHQPQHALYYNWSQSSGMPPVLVFFDVLGRELRQVSIDFEGEAVYTDTHYTPQGNIDRVSLPYRSGTQAVFSYYQYDELQRIKMVTLPDNTTAKTEYYPNSVKTINALEQTTQKYFNAAGWLVRSEDNAGKSVEYVYFSDGKLKSAQIVDQAATTIELTYNARGQRHSLSDPNYGLTLTHYDAYDRLTEQISPKKETTTFTYDGLGRMTTRNGPEGLTSWEYDITPGRLGSLKSVGNETHQTTYTYDNLLRPTQVVDRIVDDEFTTNYTYDVYGRAKTTEYPTGYSLISFYNEHGYLSHFREGGSNNKVWEALEMNALGQINRFATGNGLQTTNTYYPGNARLHTVQTKAGSLNPIQDLEYGWDALGNLNYRKKWIDRDNSIYLNESFGYDVLNRLESIHLNEKETGWHRYDEAGLGNMMEKKADNNYVFANGAYDGSRPHALTSAHVNDNLRAYTSDDQAIGWTSFDQPDYIEQGSNRLEFTYGHHRQRIRQLYKDGNGETTKTFAGNCEFVSIDGQQYAYTYLSGPAGLFGIHVQHPDGPSELFYIHTDHLGSLHTITDENGNMLQELSFDAWGNRRNPATWTMFKESPETALFDRGFTGHEHLDGFQLINMNGRLYDPVISRMLSPDNFVQSPDFSQSFNRYSYCLNNPLIYTDPSGEIVWMPIIIGAAFGGFSGWMIGDAAGATGWDMAGYIAGGALIGGLSGGAASGISAAGGGAMLAGAGAGAVGGAGFSGLSTGWDGQAMIEGAAYGALSGFVGGGVGAAIGGGGGAFAGGAVGSGLNAKLHGASWEQAGIAALGGGTMAFGAYHASSYLSWKFGGGNNLGGHDISYRQYTAMQADFQRSRFMNREYGGYLLEGGGVHRSGPGTSSQVDLGTVPAGEVAFAEYHTHWDKPGITRYVLSGGDGTYVDPAQIARETPVGQRVALDRFTTSRYHGDWDYNTGGRPSFVINRYDGSYFSGNGTNYSVINPPMNRFIYSFYFWR